MRGEGSWVRGLICLICLICLGQPELLGFHLPYMSHVPYMSHLPYMSHVPYMSHMPRATRATRVLRPPAASPSAFRTGRAPK